MKHYAIIPARNGSKSIKDKNLIKIDKKETLVERAVRIAEKTKVFDRIFLTTDIPLYLDHPIDGITTHKRPHLLATDEAKMEDVVLDVIDEYNLELDAYIWLLQPTTPFRTDVHFRRILRIIHREDVANLVSVQEVGAFHPNRMYTSKNGKLYNLRKTNFLNKQELPKVFIRNGAFYVTKVEAFLGGDYFATKPMNFINMSQTSSINIDCEWDLMMAKGIANA